METATATRSVDQLLQQWLNMLDGGTLSTASYIAAEEPELIQPLQEAINEYLARRAAGVEETLTAGADGEPLPQTDVAVPGLTILESLGHGGMGYVYRVRDSLDRDFALKLVRPEVMTPSGLERFLDEAKAMAQLDHPNVARIHHYGLDGGRPYFLMKVYPGSLYDRLNEYQSDTTKAVRLMAAVADGVGHLHLHPKGYIHRDLKPNNILLSADGQPAVSDFGLIKPIADSNSGDVPAEVGSGSGETKPTGARRSKTVAGAAVGTRAYMAPEQAAGLTEMANSRWDVWAMGVILHELFTGKRPASSKAPEKLLDPNQPDNPPILKLKPNLDPELARIVSKCLAREESQRYAHAGLVAAELKKWLAKPQRKRRLILAGLTLVMLAAVTLGAMLAIRPQGVEEIVHDSWMDADRKKLAKGETVEFDPATRIQRGAYTLIGNVDNTKPFLDAETNSFGLSTTEILLMVLADNPGVDSYRFEAEVKQIVANPESHVGIFQGLRTVKSADRERHVFATSTINTNGGKGFGNAWLGIMAASLPDEPEQRKKMSLSTLAIYPQSMRPDQVNDGWAKLRVEVKPAVTNWTMPDRSVQAIAKPLIPFHRQAILAMARPVPGETIDLPPQGGLGIFISNSACKIRNVRISP